MKNIAILAAVVFLTLGMPGFVSAQTRGQSPPSAPVTVIATAAGPGAAYVFWSPPYAGSSPITQYVITAYEGLTVVAQKSITPTGWLFFSTKFDGLAGGIYTFTVAAVNAVGQGIPSQHSNRVLIAAPAPAPSPPSMELSSSTVGPGGSITVTGAAYPASSLVAVSVVVQLTNSTITSVSTTVVTDGSGQFSATLTLPANVAGGTYTVVAQSLSTGLTLTQVLHVVVAPTIAFTVAVEGSDQALWVNHGAGFASLGGALSAAPAVVTLASGDHLYIVTGVDHNLWIRSDTLGWQIFAYAYCRGNPAANLTGGVLTVACVGGDRALYVASTTLPASGLPSVSGFTRLGGASNSGPAIAPVAGVLTYFVTGGNGAIWWWTPGAGWQIIPSVCVGHPAAVWNGTTTYLACHGSDGALWYAINAGSGWSGFQSLGGQVIDGPGIAVTASGVVFVVEGGNRQIYWDAISGGINSGWQLLGGAAEHGAAATAS